MRNRRSLVRLGGLGGLALASLLTLPGCWIWVDHHPRAVERTFDQAFDQVSRIQALPASDRGKPHKVRLLIYEQDEDELINLSVPLWLVRRVARHEIAADETGSGERLARYGLTLDRVIESGKGLLLSADADEEKVLIWLE